jgi:hypothetical protein
MHGGGWMRTKKGKQMQELIGPLTASAAIKMCKWSFLNEEKDRH